MLKGFGYHRNSRTKLSRGCFSLLFFMILATACEKRAELGMKNTGDFDCGTPDVETRTIYRTFRTDSNFNFSPATLKSIDEVLRDAKASGEDNVEFLIISNEPVTAEKQQRIKNQLFSMMYERKFIKSRIKYRGVCVYKTAKKGVRMGILRYKMKELDTNVWTDSIGDIDPTKKIPKHGVSQAYNLEAMVGNKADLVEPREYPGMRAEAAVAALTESGSSESSSDSSSSSSSSGSSDSSSSSS